MLVSCGCDPAEIMHIIVPMRAWRGCGGWGWGWECGSKGGT